MISVSHSRTSYVNKLAFFDAIHGQFATALLLLLMYTSFVRVHMCVYVSARRLFLRLTSREGVVG